MTIIFALLSVLLYALLLLLGLELCFYIIGLFLPVPPRIRQLLYAICGVLVLMALIGAVVGHPVVQPIWR